MKNLNLTIGQVLTLDELGNIMGFEAGELSTNDILTGNKQSVDNFNGEAGYNVFFELLDTTDKLVFEFVVKITDIDEI